MRTVKRLYDEGKVAIIHGIGYPNPNYSHFRSTDIWYTCEPDKVSSEGWLGKAVRDLDPKGENVLTAAAGSARTGPWWRQRRSSTTSPEGSTYQRNRSRCPRL
jgi:uncharacterized protein (DUF1501 family)